MTPYYKDQERQRIVVAEALSWVGTPFRENCAIKGPTGGVSCERFQATVHATAGATPGAELPVLPVEVVRRWHEHQQASRILEWIHQPALRNRVKRLDDGEQPMVGDIAVLKIKETEHHVGLWCGAFVAHVAIPAGVVLHSTRDPEFMKLVRCFYRIMEIPA